MYFIAVLIQSPLKNILRADKHWLVLIKTAITQPSVATQQCKPSTYNITKHRYWKCTFCSEHGGKCVYPHVLLIVIFT